MARISAFIMDFNDYQAEDLKIWLNKKTDIASLINIQKIFSQFIRYFVFEKFFKILDPHFFNDNGKPYLSGKDYFFNISHTHNKVIIVVADDDIGVDSEVITTNRDIIKIAKRYFNESEYESLMLSSDVYLDFYTLWSLKESEVKRNALGIAKGLSKAIFYKNNQQYWISRNHPRDFYTFYYGDVVISICCENLDKNDIKLFEIKDFEFVEINI